MPLKPAVKIIALFRRKTGLSMEEFMEYYENNHVPMVLKMAPFMMDYRRNFVCRGSSMPVEKGGAPDCDVITEAWFETHEAFEKFNAAAAMHSEALMQDELRFLDRDSLRMFVVDERSSDIQPT